MRLGAFLVRRTSCATISPVRWGALATGRPIVFPAFSTLVPSSPDCTCTCSNASTIWSASSGKAVGESIVNLDTLLNHRVDYTFSAYCGAVLARAVRNQHIDVILTAEASGISVAVFTAMTVNNEQWPHPASVVFAKKSRPITLPEGGYHVIDSFSYTKDKPVKLFLGSHVIPPGSRVFIVDDFLARGVTLAALGDLVHMAESEIAAFGVVVEKTFESGREELVRFNAPVYSLVKITDLPAAFYTWRRQACRRSLPVL